MTPQHRADLAAAEAKSGSMSLKVGDNLPENGHFRAFPDPGVFLASAAEAMRRGWLDAAALHLECAGEPARAALAALKAGDVAAAQEHVAEALAGLTEAQTGREGEDA